MDKVKVRYNGPGSEFDKRQMEVTPDEAKRLEGTGLWVLVKKTSKPKSVKKETNDG